MAQLTVEINGKPYVVGCEDGQERRLSELARLFDAQVRQVSESLGQLGDTRLFLMGALLMADELSDAQSRMARAESELARLRLEFAGVEGKAAAALDAAARKIEALANKVAV